MCFYHISCIVHINGWTPSFQLCSVTCAHLMGRTRTLTVPLEGGEGGREICYKRAHRRSLWQCGQVTVVGVMSAIRSGGGGKRERNEEEGKGRRGRGGGKVFVALTWHQFCPSWVTWPCPGPSSVAVTRLLSGPPSPACRVSGWGVVPPTGGSHARLPKTTLKSVMRFAETLVSIEELCVRMT